MADTERSTHAVATFDADRFDVASLVAAKGSKATSIVIAAKNEAATIHDVVATIAHAHLAVAGGSGLVDELIVVDDGSSDGTGKRALEAGARVVRIEESAGKGGAMAKGFEASGGELICFLDGDVENTTPQFASGLFGPLITDEGVALVKGVYRRPLAGAPSGGGRVNELMARPVLEVLFPHLVSIRQPLAGESATRRSVLERVGFADGYGVEIALLIDVARAYGVESIAQVDLGVRIHRNRDLDQLRVQAVEILRTALARSH